MLSTRLRAQSVFQVNGNSLSAARSKTSPFSNYVHPEQNLGSMVKTTLALGTIWATRWLLGHSSGATGSLSLSCFVAGLQLSEDHFHHLPNAHSAKTDDSASVQFETFSHPENFLGHLTPPSMAGSEWRCKISISKSSFYVQSWLWSTLVQFKFALIFCKWRRSFWSKRILNHKWTACLILVSGSLLGSDSLYTSAAECIYNWRGCYQIS